MRVPAGSGGAPLSRPGPRLSPAARGPAPYFLVSTDLVIPTYALESPLRRIRGVRRARLPLE